MVEHNGLTGRKYVMNESVFANASVNPDNLCFENNLPSGLQNVTLCKAKDNKGVPLFLSLPHFFAADPAYVEQFASGSDLSPSPNRHQSSMILETTLSVPLEFYLKIQLVVKVDPDPNLR